MGEDDVIIHCVCVCVSEANPEKFNSRFRNKMFYAGVSTPSPCDFTHCHCDVIDESETYCTIKTLSSV